MTIQDVEVIVVGAGQAGVAMSEHLSERGIGHVVLERQRIAERWRSERWDSLVANGPVWHDRFPGLEFADLEPGAFASKEQVADYFVAYAEKIGAPIRCGVDVESVRRNVGAPGFQVETSAGAYNARYVVAATGPFQTPVIPPVAPETTSLMQIRNNCPRAPSSLLARDPRECRSPRKSSGQAGKSTSQWDRTTAPREAIAVGTFAGGWECSTNGMQPLHRWVPNT